VLQSSASIEHNEATIQSETDRYIAWPAQALAYKSVSSRFCVCGEGAHCTGRKILLPAFHDELIGAGALPMDVLETRMNEWIARTAAQGGAGKAE